MNTIENISEKQDRTVEFDIPELFRRFNIQKRKINNNDCYRLEFGYCMIDGNLKIKNLPQILNLLGIDQLPNIIFLVQVDDLWNIYDHFPDSSNYPIKENIVVQLQKVLAEKKIQGVVTSFLGRDTIGMFLCLDGNNIKDPACREYLSDLAQYLIEGVRNTTQDNISIGISNFCPELSYFASAYKECIVALNDSFWSGKGTYSFYDDAKLAPAQCGRIDLDLFTSQLIQSLNSLDQEGYINAVTGMIHYLFDIKVQPTDFKLYIIKIINFLETYYTNETNLGTAKEKLQILSLAAINEILKCNFVGGIQKVLLDFCDQIAAIIYSFHQSTEDKIKIHIETCFKRYYSNSSFSLAQIASLCNYSSPYLSRLFKKLYGMNFNQYLTNYRIEKAKEFLTNTSLSIENIGYQVGFSSVNYFCTVFKNSTGMTPKKYFNNFHNL